MSEATTLCEPLLEKRMPSRIRACAFCPCRDLVAFLTHNNQLLVKRSVTWQKLFSVVGAAGEAQFTALAWSPDGKVLAVGHADGSITRFDVESGDPLGSSATARPHSCEVSCLYWVRQLCAQESIAAVGGAAAAGSWGAGLSSSTDVNGEEAVLDSIQGAGPVRSTYEDRASRYVAPPPPLGARRDDAGAGVSFAAMFEQPKEEEPIVAVGRDVVWELGRGWWRRRCRRRRLWRRSSSSIVTHSFAH